MKSFKHDSYSNEILINVSEIYELRGIRKFNVTYVNYLGQTRIKIHSYSESEYTIYQLNKGARTIVYCPYPL